MLLGGRLKFKMTPQKYKDYGAVDFENHETEVREEADEKINKEVEESLK